MAAVEMMQSVEETHKENKHKRLDIKIKPFSFEYPQV